MKRTDTYYYSHRGWRVVATRYDVSRPACYDDRRVSAVEAKAGRVASGSSSKPGSSEGVVLQLERRVS